ncbi:hypothetical protein PAI11_36850 [Patulibacter medicamentivorans]|uniref:Nitroreductase family deazaflavin-dependent oxidoreductase n=1 Tax=Patulibacter medicamentivorans TaxID=1097667 RepID=H0EA12_9ACTN|nr:nitroreductase family deazaflavin-dependent oxidoreductase [Patulibacter medicamentivorans]EHN09482.1 hypothetical protein PAI11_36850 [Patulibacter medicamentivorans]
MSLRRRAFVAVLAAHAAIYERSGGLIGHRLIGLPTLLLRTTGAKSGQPRVSALVYAKDGDRWLVVPSNGGARRASAWLHNVRANPRVVVQVGRRRQPAEATVVTRGEPDFDRLWKIADDNNRGQYGRYQQQTDRQIPVVVLTSVAD